MSSQSEGSPVDLDWLRECTDGDPEAMKTMIDLYLGRTATQLVELEKAISTGSAADVRRIAHGCVGSSGTCGMTHIVQMFKELERMGKTGELSGAGALTVRVHNEFGRIKEFLADNNISQ